MSTRSSSSAAPRDSEPLSSQLARRRIPSSLPRDILSFLLHYPGQRDDPAADANLRFYRNEGAARPRRSRCEELQRELKGNWDELEDRHDFVQWLFPIREQGVNWSAQPLQLHEIEAIKSDPAAMARLLESYRIILAFYGLRLVSPSTGELALADAVPAPAQENYRQRFRNLERNWHNFLRVTRILKCLGEFDLTQHPPSFLLFLLALQSRAPSTLALGGPYLDSPALVRSFDDYWRWCVRDDDERALVARVRDGVRSGTDGWGVDEYREWVRGKAGEDSGEQSAEESRASAAEAGVETGQEDKS
ncbi:hypothetical protein Rhopal_004396-T1 [Rhodotorula paludigena]|uniref:Opioid growth factor receptor (OGFr) conserved domain-containing protein n=1 Tax=Rhodotorula paludigena TaxID=86838 RepID=A0AAV5GNA8_9BASI|nr:hypothetical protein Rhopal_004396-T1 [Rhodotorula paludigena]